MQKERINKEIKRYFQIQLLNWYEINKRKFLWRITKNPYDIIIAEIMLQKTNAEKVEKIYPNFIEKYPGFDSLKRVSSKKLKKEIQYLGLQNQKIPIIKNLARRVRYCYSNILPSDRDKLIEINGIGDYIANAVLCFAFNKRVPIIDGNMIRILQRAFNIKSAKKNPRTDKFIWEQIEKLLPMKNYKNFNYALLDFASKVCKFYNPKCEECFFRENCFFFNNKKEACLEDKS